MIAVSTYVVTGHPICGVIGTPVTNYLMAGLADDTLHRKSQPA